MREKGGTFEAMMLALLASPASSYPHKAVAFLYFEIVVRDYTVLVCLCACLLVRLSVCMSV